MKKISAKEKASQFIEKHGISDSMKNVIQILELVSSEEDRNYWILVKSHLDFLVKEIQAKERKHYRSWDLK